MVNLVHSIFKSVINITHIIAFLGIIGGSLYWISPEGDPELMGTLVLVILIGFTTYALLMGVINWTLVVANKLDVIIEKMDAIANKEQS